MSASPSVRRTAALVVAAMIVAGAGAARAQEPPGGAATADSGSEPAAADSGSAAADSTAPLDRYLERLEGRTPVVVPVDRFPTAAEIDSVLAHWTPGQEPGPPPEPHWRLRAGLSEVRFNRVEGANVLPDASLLSPGGGAELFARAGFGWSSREEVWRGGVRLGPLTATHAREIYSYGSGGMPGNSLLALTAGKDWNDWYRGRGWTADLDLRAGRFAVRLGGSAQDQESLANATDFTLFERDGAFRPNPPIDDGSVRWAHVAVSTGDADEDRLSAGVVAAVAGGGLGGDFSFHRYRGEVVARQRLWLGDEVKARLTGGAIGGDPPFQSLLHLGGTRTLRGYDVNEFPATRYAHLSLDYKLGTNVLDLVPFVRRFRLQPVPFLDAAGIFRLQERDGSRAVPEDPLWRFSTGLGLQYNVLGIPGGKGQARLEVARRLDRGDDATTYRLGFTFER
jgi:hypothetical protein